MPEKKIKLTKGNLSKKFQTFKKKLGSREYKRTILVALLVFLLAAGYVVARKFLVVATVNGHNISRLALIKELEKNDGQQTLDNLITQELIAQAATNKSITVSEDEVNKEIDFIKKSVETQGMTLETALAYQGQTMDDLKETIRLKINVEKILGQDVAVSEEEISKYYDDNKSLFTDKTLDEVKDQIKDQLSSDKLSQKFQEWLTDSKGKADIKYFTSF